MSGAKESFIVLGKVTDAYGVLGWIRVHAFGDDPLSWRSMPTWWLANEKGGEAGGADGGWQPRRLTECRSQGATVVAKLDGIDDRTQAESLRGWLIGAPREALPKTSDNEYFWGDLIGLEVVNTQDEVLGKVEDLIETGANHVLRVAAGEGSERRERLLPFVSAVVLDVDRGSGRIRVDWGLDW